MISTAETLRWENWLSASASVHHVGADGLPNFPARRSARPRGSVLAWSTTTRRMRWSPLPPVPPARTRVKTIGRIRKNSHSDGPQSAADVFPDDGKNLFHQLASYHAGSARGG